MSAQRKYVSSDVMMDVARMVSIDYASWMQDWPLEVADAERVSEFIDYYEREERREYCQALAELIICSLDEAFSVARPSRDLLDRAAAVLVKYPDILDYWKCSDATSDEEMFAVTPWIRTL